MKYKTFWLIGLLCMLSVLVIFEGCWWLDRKDRHPTAPEGTEPQRLTINMAKAPNPRAKATSITIEAVGVNDRGEPIGPVIGPVVIPNPTFPLSIPFTLFRPPCQYRITVTVTLTRDPARTRSVIVDICQETTGELPIDTFEAFTVGAIIIQAPEPTNAGETITVSCVAHQISAPRTATGIPFQRRSVNRVGRL